MHQMAPACSLHTLLCILAISLSIQYLCGSKP